VLRSTGASEQEKVACWLQQDRGQVNEQLYLVETLLRSLADDHAATAVPDEHDRLGFRVQHLRDPVRRAL
jgi:hypothetical protein